MSLTIALILCPIVLLRQEKVAIGDVPSSDDPAVLVLSTSSYIRLLVKNNHYTSSYNIQLHFVHHNYYLFHIRYRSVSKRIAGREREWMRHSIVRALGGFTTETRKTRILYCGESFDYPELEEHPYLCNHLGEHFAFILRTFSFTSKWRNGAGPGPLLKDSNC